jgi:uncharacterized protein YjbI with pentapeptide repeats
MVENTAQNWFNTPTSLAAVALSAALLPTLTPSTHGAIYRRDNRQLIPGTENITPGPGVDISSLSLQFADLFQSNLSSASFLSSDLLSADLRYANLTSANLVSANLQGASIYYGTLTSADFTNSNIAGAIFWSLSGGNPISPTQLYSTANYQARNLQGITLIGDLNGFNLSSQNLASVSFYSSSMTSVNLASANLLSAWLPHARLADANLYAANLQFLNGPGATITRSDLRSANLFAVNLSHASLGGSNFQFASLQGAYLGSAILAGANLTSANLTQANLESSKLLSADFTAANLTRANLSFSTSSSIFTSANLTSANFYFADLAGSDFTLADLRGGFNFLPKSNTVLRGTILPNATITSFTLNSGENLRIRPGAPVTATGPITFQPGASITLDTSILNLPGLITKPTLTIKFSFSSKLAITTADGLTLNGGIIQLDSTAPLGYYKIIEYAGTIQGAGIDSVTLPATENDITYSLDLTTNPGFVTLHRGYLGDANDDGTVTFADFISLANNFGHPDTSWTEGDFNNDHATTFADFVILANNFGNSLTGNAFIAAAEEFNALQAFAVTAAPEPTSLGFLGLAAPLLLRRRRP